MLISNKISQNDEAEYLNSLHTSARISGLTHTFYRYPARFSPEFVKESILSLSLEDDVVLDTFMGGGTTIVESLANGRRAIGIDINPLAHFITKVKTTPLSLQDEETIKKWTENIDFNIEDEIKNILVNISKATTTLKYPRQRNFAKCALLNVGQWAIDCRDNIPTLSSLINHFSKQINEMLFGLEELTTSSKHNGIPKNKITKNRQLYLGSLDQLINNTDILKRGSRANLVITSPPYPGRADEKHHFRTG